MALVPSSAIAFTFGVVPNNAISATASAVPNRPTSVDLPATAITEAESVATWFTEAILSATVFALTPSGKVNIETVVPFVVNNP